MVAEGAQRGVPRIARANTEDDTTGTEVVEGDRLGRELRDAPARNGSHASAKADRARAGGHRREAYPRVKRWRAEVVLVDQVVLEQHGLEADVFGERSKLGQGSRVGAWSAVGQAQAIAHMPLSAALASSQRNPFGAVEAHVVEEAFEAEGAAAEEVADGGEFGVAADIGAEVGVPVRAAGLEAERLVTASGAFVVRGH